MNKMQTYELIASIFTKINNSKTITDGDAVYLKLAVVNMCESGKVTHEDVIQVIEFMPYAMAVVKMLTGSNVRQLIHEKGVSLHEMLFFLDFEGAIV